MGVIKKFSDTKINFKLTVAFFVIAFISILIIILFTEKKRLQEESFNLIRFLVKIKANKQRIGSFDFAKKFTNHEIRIVEGYIIYLFSDGCVDQFGGPRGKKFKHKTIKILLTEHMDKSLEEQNNILDQVFQE